MDYDPHFSFNDPQPNAQRGERDGQVQLPQVSQSADIPRAGRAVGPPPESGVAVLRAAQNALLGQTGTGYIEIDGQRYNDDGSKDDGSKKVQNDFAVQTLQTLQQIAPLVRAGTLGPDAVKNIVGTAVSDSFNEQRRVMQASRDMTAIAKGNANGTLNADQTAKALDAYEQEHGNAGMLVPEYQQFRGIRDQVVQAREDRLKGFAAESGVTRNHVEWDEKRNQPAFNPTAFEVDEKKNQIQSQKMRNLATGSEIIGKQVDTIGELIKVGETAQGGKGKADPHLYERLNSLLIDQFNSNKVLQKQFGGEAQPTPPPVAQPAVNPTAAVHQVINAPAAAPNVPAPKAYKSNDEVAAAYRSGNIAPNEEFTLNGRRVKIVGNKLQPVQ